MKNLIYVFFLLLIAAGVANSQKVVIAEQVGIFNDNLAPFLLDNRWGFIDKAGNIVIQPKFKAFVSNYGDLPAFSEGLTSIVDLETEKVGYINKSGEIAIKPVFYSATAFSEGVAIVGRQNDYVIVDTTGKILAENFVAINGYYSSFSNNRACVQREFAYGYINKSGKFVIEPIYDEAKDFSNGLAAVKRDSKWGYIDTNGVTVVDYKFSNEPKSFNSKRAFIQGKNNKWGIIDDKGTIIIEPIYDQVFNFNEGFAVVSLLDDKWNRSYQIIDVNGKAVKTFANQAKSNETITILSGFSEGLAVATKGYKKGLIDNKGNVAVGFQYRELYPISCGMAYFEKYNETTKKTTRGFIDRTGKEVIIIDSPKY